MSTQTPSTAMTKASPIFGLASRFEIEPTKLVDVLRGTVIKPDKNGRAATNEEVAAFCIVANQYGLNPFTREIHAFVSGDKGVVPIVGIDGWTHIVNSCPQFDGCEFTDVAAQNGMPESIVCKMFVKGRSHPVAVTERFSECKRNTIPWNTMPWRMLRHKAYMQAARYAFGLSGIFDEDEARDMGNISIVDKPDPLPSKGGKLKPSANGTQPAAQETPTLQEPTPPPEPPADAKSSEPLADGELPADSPMSDDEKAAAVQEEAAAAFDPDDASKEQLIAAIKPLLASLKRKETVACSRVGLSQRELGQCTEGGLRAIYRDSLKKEKA